MRIPLRRSAGRGAPPLYRQIADHLRGEIADGRLAPGTRLPPIRDLARELGVNRDTVAQAYEQLVSEGLADATVGRGTFVRNAAATSAGAPPPEPRLAAPVRRLVELDRTRPRFGAAEGCAPLHTLVPDPALYPVAEFRRALSRALARGGADLWSYAGPQGHPELRARIAERLCAAGVSTAPEDLVLCQGASQGIALALRLFTEPGDAVAVEEPTYNNVLAALAALDLRPVPVPTGPEGPDPEALAAALAREDVKLFYTIPTFHNPLGTTHPPAARRAIVSLAAAAGKPVVEDAFEADLRFRGRTLPPLAALGGGATVLHLVSFSKSLMPGSRLGAIRARGAAREGLLALRHASDLGGALPLQAALAEFVASGAYDRHLGRLRRVLRARCEALEAALARELPDGARFTRPDGGYQVWVELRGGIDTRELLPDAMRAGVLFAPGDQFHHDGRRSSALRLTFAQADEEAIERGVAALGRVVRERLDAHTRRAAPVEVPV